MAYPRLHTLRPLGTRLSVMALASLVLTAMASAQSGTRGGSDVPAYDTSGLELTLPDASPETPDSPTVAPSVDETDAASSLPAQMDAPAEASVDGAIGTTLEPIPAGEADHLSLFGDFAVPAESSGTWLNRGMWYADVEAVFMARTWNDHGVILMQEFDAVQLQVAFNSNASPVTTTLPVQSQALGESSPGYEGAPRISLGRFLFRDATNRDHTAEFVFYGGGELEDMAAGEAQLTGATEGLATLFPGGDQRGLHVPAELDGSRPFDLDVSSGFESFDRAAAMDAVYSSRFLDWQLNYNVAERMRKDRMELLPSGEWIRRASPGITYDYSAGLRYFDLEERLNWNAFDIESIIDTAAGSGTSVDGRYAVHTTNDLYGLQLGFGMTYQTDRWNFTVSTKQGAYINDARARRNLSYTFNNLIKPDGVGDGFVMDLHENGIAYVGTGSFVARYHLRQNWSLRAGWEFMFITGLAMAPNQLNFNPAMGQQLDLVGDALYHGVSVGSEIYW